MIKETFVLSGHGVDLRVKNGGLIIKSGFPFAGNIQETLISKGLNEIEHCVIIAQSGNLTIEAIKWFISQNIAVSILDEYGNHVTDFMPENHISGITKRRQATADKGLNMRISAWLLAAKFNEQRETLKYVRDNYHKTDWWNSERDYRINQAITLSLDREQALPACLNVDSQRVLEAQAAAAYWHSFEGIPLTWTSRRKVPGNWLNIGNRTSPKSGGPRKAIDPFNACLNYCYAVLETRVRNSCVTNGVDPDFGILHVDHASRTSLVFDLMEPVRPKVDRLLFEWILSRKIDPKEFFETREGVCKVGQAVISEIIPLVKGLNRDITGVVKEFAGFFKNKMILQKPEDFKDKNKRENVTKHKKQPNGTISNIDKNRQITLKKQENYNPRENNPIKNKKVLDRKEQRCLECGQSFTPNCNRQKFCCGKHKEIYSARVKRERRIVEGLCPQCGGPMPEAAKGTYKEKLTYCQKCADYWKKRYEKKKVDFC